MKQSKTGWIITILSVLVIASGGIAVKLWPRTVPVEECSPVYREYAGKPGIEASYVKDYRINDTTFVDVTMIHATTDSAWVKLCKDFIPKEYPRESINQLIYGIQLTQWTVSKSNPHIQANLSTDKDCNHLTLSSTSNSICIFHTDDIEQIMAISDEMIRKLAH